MSYKKIEAQKIGKIARIEIYPVKSCGAIALESANMTKRGLETIASEPIRDREYMVVDASIENSTGYHKFLTQRDRGLQQMALLVPRIKEGTLQLSWKNQDGINIPRLSSGKELKVRVHSYLQRAIDQGDEIAKMLSDYLGKAVRLVRASGPFKRLASQHYLKNDNPLNFQDAYPINWFFEESLVQLNKITGLDTSYMNFRPNILASGGSLNVEHSFYHVKFSSVEGIQPKPCTRCMIINVDQKTGVFLKTSNTPLHAVYKNFSWTDKSGSKQAIFAEYFLPNVEGRVRLLDDIVALSVRDPPLDYGRIV